MGLITIVVSKKEKLGYYLFLLPAFLVFAVFIFWPTIYSFVLSLYDYSISTVNEAEFVGLRNFINLFKNPNFRTVLKNTFVYTVFAVPFTMAAGLGLALLINNKLVKHKTFFKACYYIPYVCSMVAVSIVFSMLFSASTNGIVNQLLIKLGLEPKGWLSDGKLAMFVVILLSVWKDVGYAMMIYTGGLLGISEDIYEAASLDPVSQWQKLTKITLPLLKPTTLFLSITQVISSFQVFTPVNILTDGGPGYATSTIVTFLYQKGFKEYQMGMASAIAVVIFIILLILTIIQNRVGERE